MPTIASRIRTIMDDNHLRQVDFAKQINIAPSSLSAILSGKTSPSNQTFALICEKFSVNPEWLKDGIGDKDGRSPLAKEAAKYLSHAITHNSTEKDSLLRAVAEADPATIAEVCRFIQRAAAELKARSAPQEPEE